PSPGYRGSSDPRHPRPRRGPEASADRSAQPAPGTLAAPARTALRPRRPRRPHRRGAPRAPREPHPPARRQRAPCARTADVRSAPVAAMSGGTETLPLPARATLHPLELPARADAGPTPTVRQYADTRNASILETTGRDDDALSGEALLPLLYSSPDRERRQWHIDLDGEMIGCCALDIVQDDHGQTALVTVALL